MSKGSSPLARLARLCGIQPTVTDTTGARRGVSPETMRALLAAMGVPAATPAEARGSVAEIEAGASRRLVPEVLIAGSGTALIESERPLDWQLDLDTGESRSGRQRGALTVSGLPLGIHRLRVAAGGGGDTCTILVPPRRAPDGLGLTGRRRLWGFTVPLYGLRSERNLGLGDFSDLAAFAGEAARLGADFVAINPVHALFPAAPAMFSPYSPSHRRFLNVAHIAPADVPEFDLSKPVRAWLDRNAAAIEAARRGELIDYGAVAALLGPLFEHLFEAFDAGCGPGTKRGDAFGDWAAARGTALDRFATHQALSETFGAFWPDWPTPYQDPGSPQVAAFAREHGRRLKFHKYLQWVAEGQIRGAQDRARRSGMALGLLADLAVGVRPDGAETWAEPHLFARGVSLGAPADAFSPKDQNWRLAPFLPAALRRDGYRAFAEVLCAAMDASGALRMDHVLGLQRGYWIPESGAQGAYVSYPLDELLAVVRIQASRQNCLVIGEDLGNVPAGLRQRMEQAGLYGCRLMYFERDKKGHFTPPGSYASGTIASLGSHDLPSFIGWWTARDVEWRQRIGQIDAATADREHKRRALDRRELVAALKAAGLWHGHFGTEEPGEVSEALILAVHEFLASSGSSLVAVQAENAFAMEEQLNLPGTTAGHPNWRRRLTRDVTELDTPLVRGLAAAMSERYRAR